LQSKYPDIDDIVGFGIEGITINVDVDITTYENNAL
jgi:hypothetical protein